MGIEDVLVALTAKVPAFVLASLRVALTFAALPAPFGALAPVRIRTAFSLVTTLALLTPQLPNLPNVPLEAPVLAQAALYELLFGSVIGMTVRLTLSAAEVAGTLSGQAMGLGFASSVDPTHGEQVLPTTWLMDGLGTLIFFSFNCHHLLLAALGASFHAAPVGQAPSASLRYGIMHLGTDLVARGLQIAAPVVATMFVVQVGTAFVSRTAPRVHLFSFVFSITIAAGLLVLWVAAPALCTAIAVQVRHLPDALSAVGVR